MQSSGISKEQHMNEMKACAPNRPRICDLNDSLRIHGSGGRILMTLGVQSLSDERRQRVLGAIRSHSAFTPDNDPYGEHDFGEVEIDATSVMFKIDYYDLSGRFHSPDPANPTVTLRVMTVMLSDEY